MSNGTLGRRSFIGLMATGLLWPHQTIAVGRDTSSELEIAARARALKQKSGITQIRGLVPQGCESNLAPIIVSWKTQTGIDVILETVNVDEINGRISLDALGQGVTYDFALPATFGVQDLAWSGVILPYDNLGNSDDAALIAAHEHGNFLAGKRYGYQTDGDVYLLFLRQDFLADPERKDRYETQYGIPLSFPSSWEELDRQMQFFHEPSAGRFGGALFRNGQYLVWEFWSRMHAKGILPFDPALKPLIATDAGVQALEELIRASDFLYPYAEDAGLFDNWKHYAEGQIYGNLGWGGSQKFFNRQASAIRGKLIHAPLPGGVVPATAYFNWGWSYVVPKKAPSPECAFLFSRFAISPKISTLAVAEIDGYFDPFLPVHYNDPNIVAAYSQPFLEVHKAAMQRSLPNLYLPGFGSYFGSLKSAITLALKGQVSAREALNRASDEWQVVSQMYDREALISAWHSVVADYPRDVRLAQKKLADW